MNLSHRFFTLLCIAGMFGGVAVGASASIHNTKLVDCLKNIECHQAVATADVFASVE